MKRKKKDLRTPKSFWSKLKEVVISITPLAKVILEITRLCIER